MRDILLINNLVQSILYRSFSASWHSYLFVTRVSDKMNKYEHEKIN